MEKYISHEQYAVWYGSRENGLNKLWAAEYNVGNNITYETDETGTWTKSYNIYDHLGSLRSKLKADGTIHGEDFFHNLRFT